MNLEFEQNVTRRGGRKRARTVDTNLIVEDPKTPSRSKSMNLAEPKTPTHSLKPEAETPRRSARKSIKPAQDYDDIVIARTLRSTQKETLSKESDIEERKWTPAAVGRFSQKRASRKSNKKLKKSKKNYPQSESIENAELERDTGGEEMSDKIIEMECEGNSENEQPAVVLNNTFEKSKSQDNNQTEPIAPIENDTGDEVIEKETKVGSTSQKRASRESSRKSYESKENEVEINEKLDFEHKTEGKECMETLDKVAQYGTRSEDQHADVLNNTFEKPGEEINANQTSKEQAKTIEYETSGDDEVFIKEANNVTNDQIETANHEGMQIDDACDEILHSKITNKNDKIVCSNEHILTNQIVNTVDAVEKFVDPGLKDSAGPHCQEKFSIDDDQDMPSLILCDDDEEDIKNNTFNASDCVIISPSGDNELKNKIAENPTPNVFEETADSPLVKAGQKAKEIQKMYFQKIKALAIPRIIVESPHEGKSKTMPSCKTSETKAKTIGKSPSGSAAKHNIGGNGTPRLNKSKLFYKFPTPCKAKIDFKFSKADKENESVSSPSKLLAVTTLEPREIVLRSIRKRSLSTTDGDQQKRKALNVTFYSPANQTATTEDLDQLMAKSQGKTQHKSRIPRKRSISLDDNALRLPSKLPRRVKSPAKLPKSPMSKATASTIIKASSRTKLPNFSAIHEKQYGKMESLVDYLARKKERAQNLTNSALKAQNGLLSKSPIKTKPEAARALPLPASSTKKTNCDKLTERRERHIAMFKGRDKKLKADGIIKGVRSNRHFELLMKLRKTSGQ